MELLRINNTQFDEEWRDIKGYEGLYQVSNLGRVKSLKRIVRANTCGIREIPEKILTACKSNCGYLLVVLCKNGKHKNKNVHRLVAETFLPNPLKCKEVNHKDEDKYNNVLENLEWCDRIYNANYGTGIPRCASQKWKSVEMINKHSGKVIASFKSLKDASVSTRISNNSFSSVCRGKTNSAGGYKWRLKYDN